MFGKSQLHITASVSVFFFIIFLGSASTLFCLDAGRLARSQYPEGPETGHPDTGFLLVSLCTTANAGMVPDTSQLPLHASHVALPT